MSQVKSVTDTTRDWAKQRTLQIDFKAQTGSTNDDAKLAAHNEVFEFILYLTDHQTKGRGRGQNTWLDTGPGESLLSTWSFHLLKSPQAITGPRLGLALYNAANEVWPSLPWGLKAPNDLYLGGKKVAGLLVETVTAGENFRLLIGLGFNVLNHPRRFQEATHLNEVGQQAIDESEWFQFLDALKAEWNGSLHDITQSQLSASVCQSLAQALNANVARPFEVISISPLGDLTHAKGRVKWTDL